MADEKGLCVINAGFRFDEELLEKYGREHAGQVKLEKLNTLDTGIFFEEVPVDERTHFKGLEMALHYHLTHDLRLNVIVSTKRFAPAGIPAVIVETENMATDRQLANLISEGGLYEAFADAYQDLKKRMRDRPVQLTLNANNSLIQSLANHEAQLGSIDIQHLLVSIYNNALIYSRQLDERNMSIVHDNVTSLMWHYLRILDEKADVTKALETERRQSLERMPSEPLHTAPSISVSL
jgi:hypothetical protein